MRFTVPGDPPINVSGRLSTRARRLRLNVSRLGGQVEVVIPPGVRLEDARRFAADNRGWIMEAVRGSASQVRPRFGDVFPLEGHDLVLHRAVGGTAEVDGKHLSLACDEADLPRALGALCRKLARARLHASVRSHAGRLGLPIPTFRIKDTSSRWGSCSARGNLNFSWRLIMMPRCILDYVAAHEVSHLIELNHSPDFWRIVASLCPQYRDRRKWLRTEGPRYHCHLLL